jgi:EAL domain-containing protein (putative c-di-GMP-specific phosphodiesterase class I)
MDPGLSLFINVHPQELNDPMLVSGEWLEGADPHRVVLEITETESLRRLSRIREILTQLRDIGFRVALDDLGAGYAGLNSLATLEPDIVKLDISLAHAVQTDPRAARLIKHIVEFAGDEHMLVVAEGVETDAQRDVLTELGCHLVQGFLIGRPGPLGSDEGSTPGA